MEKVIIIIPVHYNRFSKLEKYSLAQCLKILKKYPIKFMIPESLEVKNDLICEKVGIETVSSDWFGTFDKYNRASVTKEFYERFLDYEYMMIYHLDAFVFSDKMDYFCNLGYDYYGAPWLDGVPAGSGKGKVNVGNGGFALKKIQACLHMLDKQPYYGNYEDVFWGECECAEFHVAPMDIALQFAFETNVRRCYLINDKKLPFGCHGWWKYDIDFWNPYIEKEGYKIQGLYNIMCECGFAHWTGWELSKADLGTCTGLLQYSDYRFYLWGSKTEGFECGYLLNRLNLVNYEYIDSNEKLRYKKLWGKKIKSPMCLQTEKDNVVIIITAAGCETEIGKMINGMNVCSTILYYREIRNKIHLYIQNNMFVRKLT